MEVIKNIVLLQKHSYNHNKAEWGLLYFLSMVQREDEKLQ